MRRRGGFLGDFSLFFRAFRVAGGRSTVVPLGTFRYYGTRGRPVCILDRFASSAFCKVFAFKKTFLHFHPPLFATFNQKYLRLSFLPLPPISLLPRNISASPVSHAICCLSDSPSCFPFLDDISFSSVPFSPIFFTFLFIPPRESAPPRPSLPSYFLTHAWKVRET